MSDGVRCCLTAGIVLAWSVACAASPEQRFAEAQALFDDAQSKLSESGADSVEARRQFYESATRFAALAEDGVASVNLYVNTGNAYHFAGDNPRALLWYLRAERLGTRPGGLATLRRIGKADLWPPEHTSIGRVLMSWHYDLSRRARQMILLVLYPIGCVMVIVSLFVRRRSLLVRLGIALIVMGSVIGISDVTSALGPGDRWAVVLEPAKGYAGDGEGYSVVVDSIIPGQEVKVLESRRQWVQVELPAHARCWLRAGVCEEV